MSRLALYLSAFTVTSTLVAGSALVTGLALCARPSPAFADPSAGRAPPAASASSPTPTPTPAPASAPSPTSSASLSGRVQLLAWIDPQNQGDVPDQSVLPDGALAKEWGVSLHLNASLGGRFQLARPLAGFTVSGHLLTAVQVRRIFSVPSAGFVLERKDLGLRIGAGKLIQPTVSPLSPSSFQFSTNWGNLLHATTGAYVAKAFGKLSAQLGFGRPSLPDFTEALTATPQAAPRLPFLEGRLAFTDPSITGVLPSGPARGPRLAPLSFSVSGAAGQQRAGLGEKAAVLALDPTAVAPLVEDVASWLASAEVVLPSCGFVLAGEVYAGRGASAYTGAVRQRPRVDPRTGRHRALDSFGGWAQLSAALPRGLTAVALAGVERVRDGEAHGLAWGLSVDGPLSIRENRLLAASLSRDWPAGEASGLRVGVQLQRQTTRYLGAPTGAFTAVLLETSLEL